MQHFVYDESGELWSEKLAFLLVISSLAMHLIAKLDLFLGQSAMQPGVRLVCGYRVLFACFEQCIVWITSGGV